MIASIPPIFVDNYVKDIILIKKGGYLKWLSPKTARFIKTIQPKAFLLENVKNLKSHDHGKTIEVIKNTITNELNYSFISFVLNACEFGDIPQNRERIYIVGFKNEGGFKAPNQKNLKQETIDTIENNKYFYSSNFRIPEKITLTKKIADLLETGSIDTKYYYEKDHIYYDRLNKEMNKADTLYQWRRVYVRENKSNLCPTLTANMGTGGIMFHC
jgi:DNA (cytosine-5)-methyltransferase 1